MLVVEFQVEIIESLTCEIFLFLWTSFSFLCRQICSSNEPPRKWWLYQCCFTCVNVRRKINEKHLNFICGVSSFVTIVNRRDGSNFCRKEFTETNICRFWCLANSWNTFRLTYLGIRLHLQKVDWGSSSVVKRSNWRWNARG